jgi:hypothetical protein
LNFKIGNSFNISSISDEAPALNLLLAAGNFGLLHYAAVSDANRKATES